MLDYYKKRIEKLEDIRSQQKSTERTVVKDSGGGAASTISESNTIEEQHKRSKSQSKHRLGVL